MKLNSANRRHLFTSFIALAFGSGLVATSATAADQTYDAANVSNVWDTTTSNWDASAAAWTNGNNAIFTGTGESVAVNGAITLANLTFSSGGFAIAPGTGSLSLAAGTSTVTATTGTSTISALLGGTGALGKAGTGRLDLTNAGNTFSGGVTLSAGDTYIAGLGAGTAGSPTAGALGNGTVTLAGGRLAYTTASSLYNNIIAQASTSSTILEAGNAVLYLYGGISGSGSVTLDANTNYNGVHLVGDNSSFTGTMTVGGGNSARHKFDSADAGSAAAKWVLNGGTDTGSFAFGTGTIHFGELSGSVGQIRNNTGGTTVATASVGALNTNSTWSGNFTNVGHIALTKVGTGTLTISATNSYDGATTINNGTLNITTGVVQNTDITVNNAATLRLGSSKTIKSLAVTGAGASLDVVNGTVDTISISGTNGLSLGGATGTDTAQLRFEVGATADKLAVTNALTVGLGGASISITNLGLSAGQSYPLITFASGSGDGLATGTGTTVGSLTLATPSLSFGISGYLEVTATGVNLITTGATPPDEAYWAGTNGSTWSATSGSNANFTTTAAGGTFLNVLPGLNTQVFFSKNSPTNLTNTLGANFAIKGLTYRATSAAVATSGTQTLTLGDGGITVESGNGGAQLAMSSLALSADQFWTNDSSNPLVVSAASVSGPSNWLTLGGSGTGGVHLGGSSFSVLGLDLQSSLDLKGTSITAGFVDSSNNITNTAAATATINAAMTSFGTLSGIISDAGAGSAISITKSGTGFLVLSGANTYSGTTSISAGTLQAGNNAAFSTGAVSITGVSGVLDLNGMTLSNALNSSATGCVITNSSGSAASVRSGFNAAGAGSYVISDLTINGAGDILWDGAINRTLNTGTLTKSGPNTLVINDDYATANSLTPSIFNGMNLKVDDGTVVFGKTVTSIPFLTINGGTFKMDPNYQVTSTFGAWQGTVGNEVFMNGGTWDLNGTGGVNNRIKRISGTGGLITNSNVNEALLVLAARDNNNPSWAGSIQDGPTLTGGPVALTINNSGSGGFGTIMTFSGTNTYSGATTIIDNIMKAGSITAFSPNSDYSLSNSTGTKLDLGDFNNTIGSLAGGANSQVLLGSATLTTGAKNDASTTFSGVISGTGGIVKTGNGTFTLTGTNTYTGDTTVSAGVLAVDGDAIADADKLVISGGKVEPTGTEVVNSLYFGASQQASGTWGATGSGATHIDDTHFSGSGVVSVTTGPAGYAGWAASEGLTVGVNDGANQDPDFDGIPNLLEYVLGGHPLTSDTSILPTQVLDATNLTLTFKRSDLSELDTTQTVQISTGLGTWTDFATIGATSSGAVTVSEGTDPEPDTVSVAIPRSNAVNGKLFARLNVIKN